MGDVLADDIPFRIVDPKDLRKKYESNLSIPLQGAKEGKKLSVYRRPIVATGACSLFIKYVASPNALASVSDSTDIPIEYRWLIPVLAIKYLSIATGEMTAQEGLEYSLKYGVKPKSYDIIVQPEVVK